MIPTILATVCRETYCEHCAWLILAGQTCHVTRDDVQRVYCCRTCAALEETYRAVVARPAFQLVGGEKGGAA